MSSREDEGRLDTTNLYLEGAHVLQHHEELWLPTGAIDHASHLSSTGDKPIAFRAGTAVQAGRC
jgi:hypothetical protein